MYIQHVVKWSEMFHSTRAGIIIVLNFRICFLHVAAGCIHVRIYKAHTNRNHIYIYTIIYIYTVSCMIMILRIPYRLLRSFFGFLTIQYYVYKSI